MSIIYENFTTGDSGQKLILFPDHADAQTFTAIGNHEVNKVKVKLFKNSNQESYPAGDVKISIKNTDEDGKPNGEDLISITVDGTQFETIPGAFVDAEFDSSISVISGELYAIVVTLLTGWGIYWRLATGGKTTDLYTGGQYVASSDGENWVFVVPGGSYLDFMFAVYGPGLGNARTRRISLRTRYETD